MQWKRVFGIVAGFRLGFLSCWIAVACLAGPAHAADRVYHATYEGSYSYRTHAVSSLGNSDTTDTLSWTMKIYWEFPQGRVTRSLVAQGSHVSVNTGAFANNDYNCSLRQSGKTANLPIDVGLGDVADTLKVTAEIPGNAGPGAELTSTGTGHCQLTTVLGASQPDGSQQTGSCAVFPPTTAFGQAQEVRNARAEGYTKKIDLDQTATPEGGCGNGSTFTATRSIHAKIIVGTGGPPVSTPDRTLADQRRQKVFAQGDLLTQLLRAEGPCGYVALGTGTFLWSSTVGGPTAPAALIPAEFLISAGAPLCATYLAQAFRDIEIANDPPAGDINAIAKPRKTPSSSAAAKKLPSCAGKPSGLRSFCRALRADLADQIAAAQRSAAIADALLTTVDRETKAHKTHHAAALRRQSSAGNRLVTDLKAAERREHAVGAKIARLIVAEHVTGRLTVAQDATAIAEILKKLRAHGVRQATVKRLAPSAITARLYDLLAHMR
jgi:hypothetical protein